MLPITKELEAGVKDDTVEVVGPLVEEPVELCAPDVVAWLTSYTEADPVTGEEKVAVTVSLPEDDVVVSQM